MSEEPVPTTSTAVVTPETKSASAVESAAPVLEEVDLDLDVNQALASLSRRMRGNDAEEEVEDEDAAEMNFLSFC